MSESLTSRIEGGIARATGASPLWLRECADNMIRALLLAQRQTHSGEFWQLARSHEAVYTLLRRHAYMVNGRWYQAQRSGWCRKSLSRVPTALRSAHQLNVLWDSLIWRPDAALPPVVSTLFPEGLAEQPSLFQGAR